MASHGARGAWAAMVWLAMGTWAVAQEPELQWQTGPVVARLGSIATVNVPEGYLFLDAQNTKQLMEMMENPCSGQELGTILPDGEDDSWFIVFEFDETGYVKDDDKDDINADKLLSDLQAGQVAGNAERRRLGFPELTILGWQVPPKYNETTQNLEWATRLSAEGQVNVNYNIRVLGRRGVMRVTLVDSVEHVGQSIETTRDFLAGFAYTPGNRYGEFRAGDAVAKYGLTALVAGGATAVAAKTGLLAKIGVLIAKLGKGIIIVIIGVLAALKAFVGRLFGGGRSSRA